VECDFDLEPLNAGHYALNVYGSTECGVVLQESKY